MWRSLSTRHLLPRLGAMLAHHATKASEQVYEDTFQCSSSNMFQRNNKFVKTSQAHSEIISASSNHLLSALPTWMTPELTLWFKKTTLRPKFLFKNVKLIHRNRTRGCEHQVHAHAKVSQKFTTMCCCNNSWLRSTSTCCYPLEATFSAWTRRSASVFHQQKEGTTGVKGAAIGS